MTQQIMRLFVKLSRAETRPHAKVIAASGLIATTISTHLKRLIAKCWFSGMRRLNHPLSDDRPKVQVPRAHARGSRACTQVERAVLTPDALAASKGLV
jgi:hypothetical protein